MAEQSVPRVRDLTSAPRRIPIEIDGTMAYEVVLALWATFNPKENHGSFELGSDWFARIKEQTPPDLADEIAVLGGPHCQVWLSIIGLLATAPHPHEPSQVYEWLASINPQRLIRWIIGYLSHQGEASLIEQAANGDMDALRALIVADEDETTSGLFDHLAPLFATPDQLPGRLAAVLNRFREEVLKGFEEEFTGAISRAAAARRATATRSDAKTVIEEVTSGLDYDIPIGVTRVILVPSVVTKPLSLIDQHRDTLLVFYAVADEFIDSDPEAPPSWLVRTYKALSDERRLRILRRLGEGGTTLDELTEMLGLSKSTVHHHISILRAAGLVRVHLSQSRPGKAKASTYSLRDQSLEDAVGFLDSYIRTSEVAENA